MWARGVAVLFRFAHDVAQVAFAEDEHPASRAWCVQAAVMLACPAVLEDPDGEQIVAAGRSGCGRQGGFRRIL